MPEVPTLRVSFGVTATVPDWQLSEDGFLERIEALAASDWGGAPQGRAVVEAVDEGGRTQWRAYYMDVRGLAVLADQIRAGRSAQQRNR
jgi:hypothetical protein